ncbi:MAG: TlpA family protein disulfide reductase [Chitinophagaceae bacterium]|nr:MAG: TlpA family protein disulfide reductase [Chitinophagaceae bacterium]
MKRLLLCCFVMISLGSIAVAQPAIAKWKITDVEQYMNSGKDEVLVINFWATFCKPCVAEIPAFIEITNKYKDKNVKLLLVSLDLPSFYPKKIAAFAKQHNFNTNIVWLEETNADYFCPKIDPKWSGSIPATLIINPKTGYRKFFEEEIDKLQFESVIKEAVGQ